MILDREIFLEIVQNNWVYVFKYSLQNFFVNMNFQIRKHTDFVLKYVD